MTNLASNPVLNAITKHAKPGMIAFDIGANRGLTAQAFSDCGARVVAFEPIKACADQIRDKAIPNVIVVEIALSDAEGVGTFHLDPRDGLGMEASSLRKLDGIDGDSITVPLTTIDAFVAKTGLVPDFLKIDVEGVEEKVLAGGMATIRQHRPIMIFEVWGYNWPRFEPVISELSDLYRFKCASDGADALKRYSSVVAENDDVICLRHEA